MNTTKNTQSRALAEPIEPCGDRPNCVSSTDARPPFKIAPLHYATEKQISPKVALRKLREVLISMGGVIENESSTQLQVTFSSRLFGFIDDLSVQQIPEQQRFELRAAARSGYYDFGVNRRRIEHLREQFKQALIDAAGAAPAAPTP